ncbi:MAG: hypothetical protein JSW18_05585 [Candidatus Omnitrophota bacterium]|nr:MAG: hypothetical protein JSW18_05585 [Candidatus Omnitrophota bacterium]
MKYGNIISPIIVSLLFITSSIYAMPTDGPILPGKGKWEIGAETNLLFEKQMKRPKGDLESEQYFTTISYAPFSWLSLDFRLGCGNLKFEPKDTDSINYNTSFAGGYGFRGKLTEPDKYVIDILYAFQHISVHPDPRTVNGVKNEIFMDDWQTSLICAKRFNLLYPYMAIKYSKVTLSRVTSKRNDRKRAGSVDHVGLAVGTDFIFGDNLTVNIEGCFFDEEAMSAGLSWRF